MELNQISSQIIKAAISVHKELGPGLLESVYQSCMVIELKNMGIKVQCRNSPKVNKSRIYRISGVYPPLVGC